MPTVYQSGPKYNDSLYEILVYKLALYFGTEWYMFYWGGIVFRTHDRPKNHVFHYVYAP